MALTWQMSHGNPASWSCRLAWELPKSASLNWSGGYNRLNRRLHRPRYTQMLLSCCNHLFVTSMAYASHKQVGVYHAEIHPSINQSINQSINLSINLSINQSVSQSINQSMHQSTNSIIGLGQTVGSSGHVIGHHSNLRLQKSNTVVSKACMTSLLNCVMHTNTIAYSLSRHNLIAVNPWTVMVLVLKMYSSHDYE